MSTTPSDPLIWLVFACCLVLSFLLSGMEAGVFALSRLRVRQQMRAGRRSAKLLHEHLENPERFLWTILVGNTLANLMILGWLVVLLNRTFPGQRVVFVAIFCPTVFLFYALFDLLPKMLFRMYPNRLCMSLARSFRFIHDVLRPLVGLVQWASSFLLAWRGGKTFTGKVFGNREELRSLMQESSQNLSSEERSMINRVLDLQSLTVRQVMTPMAQVVSIEQTATVASVLRLATERRLTRFPVWGTRNNQRRVIGIVDLNGILFREHLLEETPLTEVVTTAVYVDEDQRLEVAMRRLQRAGARLAIVLGRDGLEIGIVSLQDMLGTVFGEVSL